MPEQETREIHFADLHGADLFIDGVYRGGSAGNVGDDPLGRLLPVGNQGGFRYAGSPLTGTVKLVVLYTSGGESDWPDLLDPTTGDFTYYGDNRTPGHELHETQRKGNLLLRDIFERSHLSPESRRTVPPILLFEKTGVGRSVRFRGLLAPGSPRLSPEEELVAVWRTTHQHRFQNYRAHFTVLRSHPIPRAWLDEVLSGDPLGQHCPPGWRRWVSSRVYETLEAPRTIRVRSKPDQLPSSAADRDMIEAVHRHFAARPTDFEHFAVDTWMASDGHVTSVDVTRPTRDGGRDAIGVYAVGPASDPIQISFALEAKCYDPRRNSVGVREVARLVSRLKHRDFGVLVTTSWVNDQAYRELREDGHPVVLITGRDIVEIQRARRIRSLAEMQHLLQTSYAVAERGQTHVDMVFPATDAELRVSDPAAEAPDDPRRISRAHG